MDSMLPVVFFIVGFITVFLLRNLNKNTAEVEMNVKEPELTSKFLMGQYVESLPGQKKSCAAHLL